MLYVAPLNHVVTRVGFHTFSVKGQMFSIWGSVVSVAALSAVVVAQKQPQAPAREGVRPCSWDALFVKTGSGRMDCDPGAIICHPWVTGLEWKPQWPVKQRPCPLEGRRLRHLWAALWFPENWSPESVPDESQAVRGTSVAGRYSNIPKPTLELLQDGMLILFVEYEDI